MGLEAPLALLGLLGVLIPLLLHRMRNRELPHVVLPTFALLTRALKKTQHKRAFTDMLLLLLRIGIVALAALSLATPYVRSRLSFGDGRLASVVLVIDDSLSMSRRDGGRPLIDRARSRALEVARALPDGSELAIVLAGKPARVLVPLTRDLASVQHTLEQSSLPKPSSSPFANKAAAWLRRAACWCCLTLLVTPRSIQRRCRTKRLRSASSGWVPCPRNPICTSRRRTPALTRRGRARRRSRSTSAPAFRLR
jgi:hypothetical protein